MYILYHIIVCALMTRTMMSCPTMCSCSKNWIVDCENKSLTHVPVDIPKDTTRLILNGNNIRRIEENSLKGLKSLLVLEFSQNPLTMFKLTSSDTPMLRTLYLNNNTMLSSVIIMLPSLLFLYLDNTPTKCLWSNHVFAPNLSQLSMYNSSIRSLDITGYRWLWYLNIKGNSDFTILYSSTSLRTLGRPRYVDVDANAVNCSCCMLQLLQKTRGKTIQKPIMGCRRYSQNQNMQCADDNEVLSCSRSTLSVCSSGKTNGVMG